MKTIVVIALLLASLGASASRIEVGKPFPVLDLPLAGTPDRSSSIMDYRGRKLMLHLFASW